MHGEALALAVRADHDVRGFDIAVDDAMLVGVRDGIADLDDDFQIAGQCLSG